jgi:hypothetical protein
LILSSLLIILSIIGLLLILIPISFYYVYLVNKYLFVYKWHSNNTDSKKTPSLFEKLQNIASFILHYSIGGGYKESLKLFDDVCFINDGENKDEFFLSFKFTIKKLTFIIHKIILIILILILLLIILAIIS